MEYPAERATGHQLDLRLRSPKSYSMQYPLGVETRPDPRIFAPLEPNPAPAIGVPQEIFNRPKLTYGNRLSPELITYFPRADRNGGMMLDLGCGDRDLAEVCTGTNLEYVGLDFRGSACDVLGDAHALPFRADSFEFIVSLATLEHFRHPQVAMREAYRVLQPGGLLIGSVAFLEPFHMDSYYHHTHLGAYNTLSLAGFDVQHVAPDLSWTAVRAITEMRLFPRLPALLNRLLTSPVEALHRLWWRIGHQITKDLESDENHRRLAITAGFRYVARKPDGAFQSGSSNERP